MKIFLSLALATLAAAFLFGCSKDNPASSSQTGNNGSFGDEQQTYLNTTLNGQQYNITGGTFTAYTLQDYPPFSIEAVDTTISQQAKVTMCFQSDSIGTHALKNWTIANATEFSFAESIYKQYSTINPYQNDSVGVLTFLGIDTVTNRIWGTFAATIQPDTISYPGAPMLNASGRFNLAYKQ